MLPRPDGGAENPRLVIAPARTRAFDRAGQLGSCSASGADLPLQARPELGRDGVGARVSRSEDDPQRAFAGAHGRSNGRRKVMCLGMSRGSRDTCRAYPVWHRQRTAVWRALYVCSTVVHASIFTASEGMLTEELRMTAVLTDEREAAAIG